MNNIISNRLNWIDWSKCIAILFVVFGHIPEKAGSFLVCYITQFHMPLFFFISGYLTKKEQLDKVFIKKYWHSLIIPYIIYNILFYPYWVIRHIIECPHLSLFDFLKPIIGTIMLQHTTPYYESLNGVTWFISALLIMKTLMALSNHIKHGNIILYSIAFLATLFFIINEYNRYIIDLPFVGFTRCFPFFIIGHISRTHQLITDLPDKKKDILFAFLGIIISLLSYRIGFKDNALSYGIYFWIINISSIGGIISICRLLEPISHNIIQNVSIGTIAIMGLHWMLIGFTNYTLERILNISNITYSWYIAIIISLCYIVILYPIIFLFNKKYPFMLGKATGTKT